LGVSNMKRTVIILSLIFALVTALSASIPALANTDSKTTTVSGTVPTSLEVTAPTAITMPSLDPAASQPISGSSVTAGIVKSNKAWTLNVSDLSNGGFMKNVSTALGSKLQINVAGQGYKNADTGDTVIGSKGINSSISFAAQQTVAWTDDPSSYSITITFAGSN